MHKTLRRFLYELGVAAVVTALTAFLITRDVFDGFQRRASDALFPSAESDERVVVVAIDDETIRQEGSVTLSRSTQAMIGQQLAAAGAAVVVWDVVFTGEREGDEELVATLAGLDTPVIGSSFQRADDQDDDAILDVRLDLGPEPRFADAGRTSVAHVNVNNDPADGVVRSLPLVYDFEGRLVYSLSLQSLAALRGTEPTIRPDGVQVGDQRIPTEGRNLMRLNFSDRLDNRDRENVISAADVLTGAADPDRFRDAIVFIGATEPLAGDTLLAPVDKSNTYPGVLVHANALNTMLTASFLESVSDTENVVLVGALALLVALAVLFLPVWASVLATILLALAYILFGFYYRFDQGDVVNIVYALLGIVGSFIAALGVKYLTETRQRRRVSMLFSQYVPEQVARQLEESGALEEHVEGERVDVGLFFCDLRGFTSLSATLEPSEVRAMLNQFYDLLTEIIYRHGGTVLKFVGDEVFAVFGAPLPCDNNAQSTLDCAMEIQRRAPELDEQLSDLGIPPVKFGIGMNAGWVVAAHIGGGRRRQYDIVGDTVNLASRLCSQAGKGEIVLPEALIERLSERPPMESMGAVALKGLEEPVPLLRVVVGAPGAGDDAPVATPAST